MKHLEGRVDQVRANGAAMGIAALGALAGVTLPWFRFEIPPSLLKYFLPSELDDFRRTFTPIGPLDAFARVSLTGFGVAARAGVTLLLGAGVWMLAAGLLIAWRERPLWPARVSLALAALLLLGTLISWGAAGVSLGDQGVYIRVVPTVGWFVSVAAYGAALFFGTNVLRLARGREL